MAVSAELSIANLNSHPFGSGDGFEDGLPPHGAIDARSAMKELARVGIEIMH